MQGVDGIGVPLLPSFRSDVRRIEANNRTGRWRTLVFVSMNARTSTISILGLMAAHASIAKAESCPPGAPGLFANVPSDYGCVNVSAAREDGDAFSGEVCNGCALEISMSGTQIMFDGSNSWTSLPAGRCLNYSISSDGGSAEDLEAATILLAHTSTVTFDLGFLGCAEEAGGCSSLNASGNPALLSMAIGLLLSSLLCWVYGHRARAF